MGTITTNEYSYDGAKFKCQAIYSYTKSSITFHTKLVVTGKFKSKRTVTVHYIATDGSTKSFKYAAKHNATFLSKANKNVARNTLRVWFTVGAKTTNKISVAPNRSKASTPESIIATKENDARYSILVTGRGWPVRPTHSLILERATDTKTSWSQIGEELVINDSNEYSETFIDDTTEAGHKYWWRVKATNTQGGDSGYIYTEDSEYTTPQTNASVQAEAREGFNLVKWSVDSVAEIDRGILRGWSVLKSINGGSFSNTDLNGEARIVEASPDQYNYEFEDREISPGNRYKYAIQGYGDGGQSFEIKEATDELTTAPARPLSVEAYKNSDNDVVITIRDNINNPAEDVIIERSTDGINWTVIATESFPVESYVDDTASGLENIRYRVKNRNEQGDSGYTESLILQTSSKPNPPDLVEPYKAGVLSLDQQSARLVWRHNSTDGSPQEEAELDYKVNEDEWTTIELTDESYYDLALSSFSANDVITWRVKTKGSFDEFSDYSEAWSFTLLSKPVLQITSPENGEVIEVLPIELAWTYNDESGNLAELYIDIIRNNNVEKTYQVDVGEGESGSYTYSLAGFLFQNDTSYGIRLRALSTSGLSTAEVISISVQYLPISLEGGLLPTIVSDEETGKVYITILRDETPDDEGEVPEPVAISEAYLYRIFNGERTLVASGLNEGSQVVDNYAPLNVDFQYELLLLTEDGDVSLVDIDENISSDLSFIYFGDEVLGFEWNPKSSGTMTRPEREEKYFSGRTYPLSFDTKAVGEGLKYSTTIIDRYLFDRLKALMRAGRGQGVWKSADGESYFANFELSWDLEESESIPKWDCDLTVKRIEANHE